MGKIIEATGEPLPETLGERFAQALFGLALIFLLVPCLLFTMEIDEG